MATDIQDDEAFVGPQDKETATRLLKAAEDAGLDPSVVRTTQGGFIVPADLVKNKQDSKGTTEEKAAPARKPRGKVIEKES